MQLGKTYLPSTNCHESEQNKDLKPDPTMAKIENSTRPHKEAIRCEQFCVVRHNMGPIPDSQWLGRPRGHSGTSMCVSILNTSEIFQVVSISHKWSEEVRIRFTVVISHYG
jgi:hypothetical protein